MIATKISTAGAKIGIQPRKSIAAKRLRLDVKIIRWVKAVAVLFATGTPSTSHVENGSNMQHHIASLTKSMLV